MAWVKRILDGDRLSCAGNCVHQNTAVFKMHDFVDKDTLLTRSADCVKQVHCFYEPQNRTDNFRCHIQKQKIIIWSQGQALKVHLDVRF
jgi:hypothetical protein